MIERTRHANATIIADLTVPAKLTHQSKRLVKRISQRHNVTLDLAVGSTKDGDDTVVLERNVSTDLRCERINQIVFHEGVVERCAAVRSTEVGVTIVDLHVTDADREILHKIVQRIHTEEAEIVKLDVAALDPRLVVVTRGQVQR